MTFAKTSQLQVWEVRAAEHAVAEPPQMLAPPAAVHAVLVVPSVTADPSPTCMPLSTSPAPLTSLPPQAARTTKPICMIRGATTTPPPEQDIAQKNA
jgi:hypothetical protein